MYDYLSKIYVIDKIKFKYNNRLVLTVLYKMKSCLTNRRIIM